MSIIAFSPKLVVIKIETKREWEIVEDIPITHKRRINGKWQIRRGDKLHIPEITDALVEEKCQLKMF